MQINLLVVGKTNTSFVKAGFEEYKSRLKHYVTFNYIELPDVKKQITGDLLKKAEGEKILQKIKPSDKVILLDENGKMFRSVDFAKQIEKWQVQAITNIVFVVGGAYGFSSEVYKRADLKMSLSLMTFSHQMIRLIFIEQLYRAFTIIKGEKYHHE
jgi:23S rRNA (pseudouridine1915-N3)-methyltransferase